MPGGRDEAVGLLAQADTLDKNVHNRVSRALSLLKDPDARDVIAEATRSAEWRRRFAAARAMRGWPDEDRLPISRLQALLTDPHDSIRWASVRTVRQLERLDALGRIAASDPSPTVRRAALFSLATVPAAESIALAALTDDDYRVRGPALYFFRRNPEAAVFAHLLIALTDQFASVRANAVWAIADIGGTEAAEALIPILHDRKRRVRWAAARALGKLGEELALEPLIDLLERSTTFGSKQSAIVGLADLNDRRAVEPIVAALRNASDDNAPHPPGRGAANRENLRRTAAIALLRLGGDDADREIERLPESWLERLREQLRREEARRRSAGGPGSTAR